MLSAVSFVKEMIRNNCNGGKVLHFLTQQSSNIIVIDF